MGFFEDVEAAANRPIPGDGASDAARRRFDAMTVDELATQFRWLQYLTLRDQTDEVWDAILYFDRLPHEQPERTFEVILAVLRSYADKPVKMALNERFFSALTPGGWLIVGHAEPQASVYHQFEVHNFPNTVIYRKPLDSPLFAFDPQADENCPCTELPPLSKGRMRENGRSV